MKILFVNRLYHGVSGGIERVSLSMMNEFCIRGYEVELLSWDQFNAKTFYPLNSCVTWHKLGIGDANKKAGLSIRFRRQLAIRKILKKIKPDVVIAFQHGAFLTIAVAALNLNVPIIAAERNAPERFDHLKKGYLKNIIFQTFRLAHCITVQMEDYIKKYPVYLKSRITYIPNHVDIPPMLANSGGEAFTRKTLLTVGRLSYQKNQEALIKAFAKIAPLTPSWRLVIIGSGEDELKLKALVDEIGLKDRISFIGAVSNVSEFYLSSHLFCLSSRWEGFPNALAEAMAYGLPSVGFAECAGVSQLIRNANGGILAKGNGSIEHLAESLLALMTNDELRKSNGMAAAQSMMQYSPNKIWDRWEALFSKLGSGR